MERPILFSGEMVRAILAGRKTQTRRIIKPQPRGWNPSGIVTEGSKKYPAGTCFWCVAGDMDYSEGIRCPYGIPGDMLWVRETFMHLPLQSELGGRTLYYRADDDLPEELGMFNNWKPSIFMRRKHSRITLEISRVRVERLQEITEQDAQAEGMERTNDGMWRCYGNCHEHGGGYMRRASATASYMSLWNRINGKTFPWDANPWVWVIEFERVSHEQENL